VTGLRVRFGLRLKSLRIDKGLTQGELAELVGLSVDFIGLIERGERSPSFESLDKLSKVFNIPVSSLFEDTKKPRASNRR
jgi:transcriptional regulator with XRE-family HTH domain